MKKIIYVIVVAATLNLFASPNSQAFTATGFQNPYGIAVSPKGDFIYVSNVNAGIDVKDDNGFISRLKIDGAIDQMRFIDGASKDVTLHAPKGMVIVADKLYVTDVDKLHVFNVDTGKFLFDLNFGNLPVRHFYDITTGPDESLYLTDAFANVIYRINVPKLYEVTTLAAGDVLGQPHGITWYPAKQIFVVAGFASGKVIALDKAGKRQPLPSIFLRTLEGLRADDMGNLYVSSVALSSVFRIASNFGVNPFELNLNTPSGIAYLPTTKEILVTSFEGGTLQSIPLLAQ